MKKVYTNDLNFFKYCQSKFIDITYSYKPNKDGLNVFFPESHNITICGTAYMKDRIESGDFHRECQTMLEWLTVPNTILITPITMFGGPKMREIMPYEARILNEMDITKQVINTWKLGELIQPHRVQIWSNNGTTLKPITDKEPIIDWVYYGKGKRQQAHYINVFNGNGSKETRRKQRRIAEYALYSEIYNQIIQ